MYLVKVLIKQEVMKDSLYLLDSSELDGKCETIMDYTISWTLRRAQELYRKEKPVLFGFCREILAQLLDLPCSDSLRFESVETWKQSSYIDVWVEVELSIDGLRQKHAILIENKYYTGLHLATDVDGKKRNQLLVYRKKFDAYYEERQEGFIKHYALITCIDRTDPLFHLYDEAPDYGFTIYPLEELHDYNSEDSESDIFNEFWVRGW